MASPLRATLKRLLPRSAKQIVFRMRETIAQPPIDDVVLADYRFVADEALSPRLNLVMPNLTVATAFGGVTTGIAIFLEIAKALCSERKWDFRVILTDPDSETSEDIFRSREARIIGASSASFLRITDRQQQVPVRRQDLFVAYNWWASLNVLSLIEAQSAHFASPVRPLLYLVQEYEPHLMAFSSAHVLAREAYDTPDRLWAVINSSNLGEYFKLQGHVAERSWVFEPVVDGKLRSYLDRVDASPRKKQILVYGRPGIARNCFPALMRGLRKWASDYPEFRDWSVISAGTEHKPVALGDGRAVTSVGKLSLEDYAETLLTSSVGISLMASPHPSYPPLEMAHFGVRTITNGYLCKDLGPFHPNIRSVASMGAAKLSEALAEACRAALASPPSTERNPVYTRDEAYPFIADLAAAITSELA